MSRSYEVLSLTRASAVVRCANCDTRHTVDLDEDGEPCLDTDPCHDDDCTVHLCEHCPQFECEVCQLDYCASHRVEFSGMEVCRVCLEQLKSEACDCQVSGDQADASDCPAHGGRHAA